MSLEGIKSYRKRAQQDRKRAASGRHKARCSGSHVGERRTKIVHMQHLFRFAQNHLSNESGLLLARVGAQCFEQRSLTVAEAQLDEVLANKGGVGVHGVGVVVVGGNAGRTSGGWISAFDAAVAGLGEIVARAIDASAPCQPARQQDEHGPTGDEEQEVIGVHGSVPRDVLVDQVQADQQHSGCEEDGEAKTFVEVHLSLLVVVTTLREPEIEAVANHADRDGAEDEDEEGHGRSVLEKKGAKRPEEAAYCEEAHEAQGEEGGGGHLDRLDSVGQAASLAIQRRATLVIARTARWLDGQRLCVVVVVVVPSRRAAVHAGLCRDARKLPLQNCMAHLATGRTVLCVVLTGARQAHGELECLGTNGVLPAAETGDGPHGSDLGLLLAALNALVQRLQLVADLERRLLRQAAGQIANGRLVDPHESRDLILRHASSAEVLKEFGPVHGKPLWAAPYGLSHSFFLSQC